MSVIISWIDTHPVVNKLFPLVLTLAVLAILTSLLYSVLIILNLFPVREQALIVLRPFDILVGITIYLKTSIDFAIFMGRLMAKNPGWRSRIAIEVGTAAGNAFGTILIIALWFTLKSADLILAGMVFLAAVMLLLLAHSSLYYIADWRSGGVLKSLSYGLFKFLLEPVKRITDPVLSKFMPGLGKQIVNTEPQPFDKLLSFSVGIPFILGLDDFAGYVPLFTIVNLYSFAVGVLAGHTLLNIALFLSPERTIKTVKNQYVTFTGILAFIGLSLYGFWEVIKILINVMF